MDNGRNQRERERERERERVRERDTITKYNILPSLYLYGLKHD